MEEGGGEVVIGRIFNLEGSSQRLVREGKKSWWLPRLWSGRDLLGLGAGDAFYSSPFFVCTICGI